MATKHIRVLQDFGSLPDDGVVATGTAVVAGLTNNKNFQNLPYDLSQLQTGVNDLTAAIAAAAGGGVHATALKNKVRRDVIVQLRRWAMYVQANSNDELAAITSSGFRPASLTRASGPLPKAVILSIDHGHSTQLLLTFEKVDLAKAYEVEVATVTANTTGPWQRVGVFTKTRKLPINNLTPGTYYAFHVRAIGGTTGAGDWSDPQTHICA